jgi:hypothetical protein
MALASIAVPFSCDFFVVEVCPANKRSLLQSLAALAETHSGETNSKPTYYW